MTKKGAILSLCSITDSYYLLCDLTKQVAALTIIANNKSLLRGLFNKIFLLVIDMLMGILDKLVVSNKILLLGI